MLRYGRSRRPGAPASTPLLDAADRWQRAMIARMSPEQARLFSLREAPRLEDLESTRRSLRTTLASLEETARTSERSEVALALAEQERARIRARLSELDDAEPLARERASVEAGRPAECACLGTGCAGRLIAVLSGGVGVFDDYCACPDGQRAQDLASWAREGADEEQARLDGERDERVRQAELTDRLSRAGISQIHADCTFAGYRAILSERRVLTPDLDRYLTAAEASYSVEEPLRGDFLYGMPGHGKTSLLVSMLRAWIERGRAGYFIRCQDLVDRIRESMARRDGEGDRLMATLRTVPFLALDDLAMHAGTPFERSRIVGLIVYRHAERLLTGITSNYSPDEAARRLSSDEDRYEATRLSGRFSEMCDVLHLRTADLRTTRREDVPPRRTS